MHRVEFRKFSLGTVMNSILPYDGVFRLFDSQKEVIKRLMLVVFTTLIINTNVIGSWMAIAIKSGSTCTETLVRALFGSVIFLCFFVYPSQQMSVDCCLDVFCYQTYNWYAYSPKTRSLLLIIMMRASKPMILSAGASNFPMDLRNAGTIMSKITSYIMALLSLYE
ncbi:hypothetical protein TKK_0010632 [Trichogramma kaykai]